MFREAVREAPEDADLHTVLGVVFNLSREYDLAIAAFRQALELKPKDYSLVR
jgi:peroxin-5